MGKINGGARPGAGRKPKADEIKLIEQMDAVLAPIEAWQALATKVESGDVQAQKTWLSYRYGMPKQMREQTTINIDAGKLTDEEIKKISNRVISIDKSEKPDIPNYARKLAKKAIESNDPETDNWFTN